METCWGLRHMIIHRAGVVSRDFVRRHRNFSASPGKRIALERQQLIPFHEATSNFVETTESYLRPRLAAERRRPVGDGNPSTGAGNT